MPFVHLMRRLDPGVVVVTVPTTNNPNLHAQSGMFTLVRFKTAPKEPHFPPNLDDLMREERVRELRDETDGCPKLPMLYKLTMPAAEAPELLYYLALSGIDGASIYHGLGAVFEGMGEDRFRKVMSRQARVDWGLAKKPGD